MTTYAPNAIERTWRLVKGLISEGRKHKNIAEVIAALTKAVTGRIQQGAYSNMVETITHDLQALRAWPNKKMSGRDDVLDGVDLTEQGEERTQHKRLDLKSILQHYRAHGGKRTFLMKRCNLPLATGA